MYIYISKIGFFLWKEKEIFLIQRRESHLFGKEKSKARDSRGVDSETQRTSV